MWIGVVALAIHLLVGVPDARAADVDAAQPTKDKPEENAPAKARHKRADPSDWSDWRNYRPSVAGGFGVTFDHVDSKFDGVTRWRAGGQFPECQYYPDVSRSRETCITVGSSNSRFVAGGAFNLAGRLTLPEFDVPSKPQIFANASWAPQRQEQKAISYQGVPAYLWTSSADFLGGSGDQDKFQRLEQTFDPKSVLFVGLGASFELPVEAYPIRLNATVNYFRAAATVGARYDYTSTIFSANAVGDPDLFVSEELISHGIAPGVGLDAVIGTNRWFEFGFYTDFFVGFPLSNVSYEEELRNAYMPPTAGPEEKVTFYFDRDVNYSVFIGLRLSLARD